MAETSSAEPFSTIRVRDGRTIGYLEVGKTDGSPVFHFHGHGSSRLEALFLAEPAAALGVRLVALDRPGIGRSDPAAGHRLMDWPDDVADVADHLGIARFAVAGVSAGGPYALACACKIPGRLTGCGMVSTLCPPDLVKKAGPGWMRAAWWAGARYPGVFRSYLRLAVPDSVPSAIAIEKRLLRVASWVGKADQKLLRTPELRTCLARAMAESRRQGGEANRQEAVVQIHPWGFEIEQTAFGNVFLWHGEQDRVMPVAPARLLAQALPHCRATFYVEDGHFSTLVNHAGDVLTALRA